MTYNAAHCRLLSLGRQQSSIKKNLSDVSSLLGILDEAICHPLVRKALVTAAPLLSTKTPLRNLEDRDAAQRDDLAGTVLI